MHNDCPGGRVFLPSSRVRGGMVLYEIDTCIIQRVKIAHSFLQFVSNLFHFYHFKLAYVVLHVAVKEFF